MNDLTKKMLESGLVDESTAAVMEKWGLLEAGASELAKKATLKDATREQLIKFADEIGEEVDKQRRLKESMLDLNQLRWPTNVMIFKDGEEHARYVVCVIDRMGRYYFRPQDVKRHWFVPGYELRRTENDLMPMETILEVTELFVGDQVAAIQVSTEKNEKK